MENYKLRVSSSIAPFREKAEKTWGLKRYRWPQDAFKPVVFFGMYHIGDYFNYMRHMGENVIIWAGSDILNLKKGFNKILRLWFRNIDNYCENDLERQELAELGIEAFVTPTFLEDIDDFPISFTPSKNPVVYISTRPGREEEYGLSLIKKIKDRVPEITFKVFDGTVSNEVFNEEIKKCQCGLRTLEHDGFSEITAKSVLMGQYPITRIKYPMIDHYETEEGLITLLKELKNKTTPNHEAMEYWRENVNAFPFIHPKT